MTTIDTRVVEMKFNNAEFEAKAAKTLASLQALKKSMKLEGAAQGLNNIDAAGKKVNLNHIANGVDAIANKMRTLTQVGIGVLTNLASQATQAGLRMVKAFTIAPIIGGYHEYETKLNSIQTILANTASAGTTLKDVTHTLNELNHYADQTIYNFGEMARNIGTFTAAGVDLKTATGAIKGIANLAALSGSNSQQASTAMYQLSQAISAGTVNLEDWNSVVNAGMGGTVFQRALAQTAVSMGRLKENAVKLDGPMKNVKINGDAFRKSIMAVNGESWLNGDVLVKTLQQFTGDLSDADLAAQGFNKTQIKAIQQQAKLARAAATEVKTLSGLFDTLKESVGSGWAQSWEIIVGDFEQAKKLWTSVNNVVGGVINRSTEARNKMLSDWAALGGRKALLDGLANVFRFLGSILKPIGEAFREAFPPTTGKRLAEMSKAFLDFTEKLKIGGETANNIKRTFAGMFAVLGIGWDIIKEVVKTLLGLFTTVGEGSGSFLDVTANIGDFLVGLRKAIKEGEVLQRFFGVLGKILAIPIKIVQFLAKAISSLFDGFDSGGAKKVTGAVKSFEPLGKLGELIAKVWGGITSILNEVWDAFGPMSDKIVDFFNKLGSTIGDFLQGLDFEDVLSGINTGLFAGLLLFLKNFLGGFGNGPGGGFIDNIKDAVEGVTDTFGAMQNTLRATTLLQIAAAIGILALALNVLAKIDANKLKSSLTAMGVMFAQLMTSMLLFEKFSGFTGFAKMPFIATSMILLGLAINILASAVKKLAELNWNELAKGLTGTVVLLGALVLAVRFMPNGPSLIGTGLGLIAVAAAVKILASAVEDFSGLSWNEIARGLVAMAGSLAIVGAALTLIPRTAVLSAAGVLVVAISLGMVADALKKLGDMSWGEIAKGLVAMLGSLAIITAALYIIPPTAPLSAAGILVAAISMGLIADALKKLGDMSWGEIAKGLVAMLGALGLITAALYIIPPTAIVGAAGILVAALALEIVARVLAKLSDMSWGEIARALVSLGGALLIIAVGVTAMTLALPGAAALLVIAGALAILTPILVTLGNMSWGEILKGLIGLAGVFTVLGVAGVLLTPVVATLLLLGVAVTLLGVGILAVGGGVLLFATALTALAAAGGAATLALVAMISALAGTIPLVMTKIGEGIVAFATAIAKSQDAITDALVAILISLIDAIVKVTPKIVEALYKMLTMLLNTMRKYVPKMVDSGLKLVIGILNGIAKNAGKMSDAATRVAVAFINGISRNLPKITNAGANLIIKFVNTLASTIRSKSPELGAAGANLASAIIEGMARGLLSGIGTITARAREVAQSALNAAKSALGIHSPSKEFEKLGKYVNEGFIKGLKSGKKDVDAAFNNLKSQLVSAYKASAKDIKDAEKQLKKLYKARVLNNQVLDKAEKALAQARKEHKAERAAYLLLTKTMNDERSTLGKLANKRDEVTKKLEEANKVLEDATKTRDDYNKSVADQYSSLTSITKETRLNGFTRDLQKQLDDTKKFATLVQQLRDLGLNDQIYKKLIESGPESIPFMQQLLASGAAGIADLNKLGAELETVAGGLGKAASTELYQAAVDSAAGIVKGLQNQEKAIQNQMNKIADAMVKAIKKKLGIKSPSREFAKVGVYSAEGLAKGLTQASGLIEKSAENVGQSAVDTLRKSIASLSSMVESEINSDPTITPVLDLSNVRKNAAELGTMFAASISVNGAYNKAKVVQDGFQDNKVAESEKIESSMGDTYSYTQNNYSPKALSSADIYRQTKNQISTTKNQISKTKKGAEAP